MTYTSEFQWYHFVFPDPQPDTGHTASDTGLSQNIAKEVAKHGKTRMLGHPISFLVVFFIYVDY